MQITRASGSTGGTNSAVAAGRVGPAGPRCTKPAGSDQKSRSGASTATSSPFSARVATSTSPSGRRMPTILIVQRSFPGSYFDRSSLVVELPVQERQRALHRVGGGLGCAEPHVVGVVVQVQLGVRSGVDQRLVHPLT